MARKRQRKKKKSGLISNNLVVPFSRFHSPRVKPAETKKGRRNQAKKEEKSFEE